MPDWKKEIKLSDLFKRDKAEERATEARPSADDSSKAARPSFWKRELKLSQLVNRGDKAKPEVAETDAADPPAWSPVEQTHDAVESAPSGSTIEPQTAPGTAPVDTPAQADPALGVPDTSAADAVAAASTEAYEPEATPVSQQLPPADTPAEQAETVGVAATESQSSEEEETSVWKRDVRASDILKKMGWSSSGGPKPHGKASEQKTPRPDGPRADSPAADPSEGSVWKRELKAGDLFRRREKAPPVPGDAFSADGAEPVSFWKKEISLTDLLRKPGSESESGGSSETAPGEGADAQSGGKKKRGKITLPKLGGSPFSKSRGLRRGSPNAPIAVPLTRAVNLLPPDLAQKKKGAIGPAEIGVGVAAVAIVAGLFILFTSASSKVSDAEQALETVQAEQEALAQSAAELIAAAGGGTVASPLLGEEGDRASALSTALASRTAWDRVLRRVTVVMPADTWLRGLGGTSTTSDLALNAGPGADLVSTLTLTGYSLNRDGVAKLLSRMETIPELATVQLLAATQTQLNGSTVIEYSITATLKDDVAAAPQATTIGTTP